MCRAAFHASSQKPLDRPAVSSMASALSSMVWLNRSAFLFDCGCYEHLGTYVRLGRLRIDGLHRTDKCRRMMIKNTIGCTWHNVSSEWYTGSVKAAGSGSSLSKGMGKEAYC